MENGPFEDVFPIQDGDFPTSYVSLPEGRWFKEAVQKHPSSWQPILQGGESSVFKHMNVLGPLKMVGFIREMGTPLYFQGKSRLVKYDTLARIINNPSIRPIRPTISCEGGGGTGGGYHVF